MKGLLIVITVAALAMMIAAGQAMAQATTAPPPAKGSQVAPGAGAPAPAPGKAEGCRHWRHGRGMRLGEKLGLTDDQKAQVKAIMTAAREQAKAATDREAKVKIFRDAFEKVKTTVLTDAQRQKLADLKAQWKTRREGAPAKAAPAAA